MKVYLLEAYDDESDWIIGICSSLESARAAIPENVQELQKLEFMQCPAYKTHVIYKEDEEESIYGYFLTEYEVK